MGTTRDSLVRLFSSVVALHAAAPGDPWVLDDTSLPPQSDSSLVLLLHCCLPGADPQHLTSLFSFLSAEATHLCPTLWVCKIDHLLKSFMYSEPIILSLSN